MQYKGFIEEKAMNIYGEAGQVMDTVRLVTQSILSVLCIRLA